MDVLSQEYQDARDALLCHRWSGRGYAHCTRCGKQWWAAEEKGFCPVSSLSAEDQVKLSELRSRITS